MMRSARRIVPILAATLAFAARAAAAGAEAAPWSASAEPAGSRPPNRVRVDLRASASGIAPGGSVELALTLDHEDGWHSYWLNPGDAGLPTTIEWILPAGLSVENTRWPTPLRIEDRGAVSYGYEGSVSVLASLRASSAIPEGRQFEIEARVSLLACKELCVAETSAARLALGSGAASAAGTDGAFFSRAASGLPSRRASGRASIAADGSAILRFAAEPGSIEPTRAGLSYFFPEEAGVFAAAAPQEPRLVRGSLVIELEPSAGAERAPEKVRGLLRVGQGPGEEWLVVDLPVEAASAGGIAAAIALAFLGGLLLNLMPCVLPVLSLKVMSLIRNAGSSRRRSLGLGLAYAAGVIASFLVLLGLVLVLEARGLEGGWGFQFRSPFALAVMALLFFLSALTMLGAIEVGASIASAAGSVSGKGGYIGSFLSGALSTAAATPCTAPFMGAAIGTALASGGPAAVAIFSSLGAGMAAPYVILCAFPSLLLRLPRAGRWTETLKQALAFPLFATAVWLALLLEGAAGGGAVISLMSGVLAASLGAWIRGRFGHPAAGRVARTISGIAALLLLATALALLPRSSAPRSGSPDSGAGSSAVPEARGGIEWRTYEPRALDEAIAQGKTVFIDFTADWCLTCTANEIVAFRDKRVIRAFAEMGIVAMKADWTRPDERIERAVQGYGRSGIPLYVVHRGSTVAEILPEILTPRIVLDSLSSVTKIVD